MGGVKQSGRRERESKGTFHALANIKYEQ